MTTRRTHRWTPAPILTTGLAVASLLGLAACSPATNLPYTPAAGANADVGTVKVRNIALVSDGSRAALTGAIVAGSDDKLVEVDATSSVHSLDVNLPARTLVKLDGSTLTLTGVLTPGTTTQLKLTFQQAGEVDVTTPIISNQNPDFATVTPQP